MLWRLLQHGPTCLGVIMFTPAAILLTRQKTAVLERMEDFDPRDMLRGAYIVQDFSYELDEQAAYSLKNPDCPV